jgi:hypothetical protein
MLRCDERTNKNIGDTDIYRRAPASRARSDDKAG